MATLTDLQQAVDNLLQHPLGPQSYALIQQVEAKAYEAYVFGLCLRAVRELGVIPELRGITSAPCPFVFRGAPGTIHSVHKNFGYAFFEINNKQFEIHAGVEFLGTSKMTHELDVAIMLADEADKCRRSPRDPKAASVIGAWECKFYDSPLGKHLARAFVGLIDDMGTNIRLSGLCSNQTNPQISQYFKPQRRPYPHLMLSPDDPASETRFVGMLSAELKKMTGA